MKDNPKISWGWVLDEATRILRHLIRMETVAGEGREAEAALFLLREARKMGLVCRVEEPQTGRGSFIAKITGAREESLLLLSHLDVAPVLSPSAWRYPPFSGQISEEAVWGRGAIDCKGLVVVWLMVLSLLRQLDIPLCRSVIMVATADEESGGKWGLEWLMQNAPELQTPRWALNEGGGFPLQFGRRQFITCQTGEKGYAHLRWQRPGRRTSSQEFVMPASLPPSIRQMSKTLKTAWFPDVLSEMIHRQSALTRRFLQLWWRHLQRYAPHRLDVHQLLNHAAYFQTEKDALDLHLRSVPGTDIRDVLSTVASRVGLPLNHASQLSCIDGTESPLDTKLYRCIEQVAEKVQPSTQLLPHITPGFSDSRFLRLNGIPTYGFFPLGPDTPISSQHAINERLPLKSLRQAIEMLFEVVLQFCSCSVD